MTTFKNCPFHCFPVAFVIATTLFASCTQSDDVSVAQNNALRDSTSVEAENKLNEYRFDLVPKNALGVIAFRPSHVLAEEVMGQSDFFPKLLIQKL